MALRDLLVHVDLSEAGLTRMRLAAGLALLHQSRLVALHVRELDLSQQRRLRASELGLIPAAEIEALNHAIAQEQDAGELPLRSLLDQLNREHGLVFVFRAIAGHAPGVVSQQARTADLAIIGHDPFIGDDTADEYSFAESMLFASGRPLLLVPPGTSGAATLGRRVAVAWNGSRPAARALSDAIPLIEKAERVVILAAEADRPDLRRPSSIEPVLEHLRLHAKDVEVRTLEAGRRRLWSCEIMGKDAGWRHARLARGLAPARADVALKGRSPAAFLGCSYKDC